MDVYADEEVELGDMDSWVVSDQCTNSIGINFSTDNVDKENIDNIPILSEDNIEI